MVFVLPKSNWPKCLHGHKALIGVAIGGCICGKHQNFYRKTLPANSNRGIALAHAHTKGKFKGWMCLPYKTRLRTPNLLRHELAHLLNPGSGHNAKWRNTVRKLGGSLKRYRLIGSSIWAKSRLKKHRQEKNND